MPLTHSNQPQACINSGTSSRGASIGSTRSHLGTAVNRKPEKKRGVKPKVMTAACTSVGDNAYGKATTALTRSHCTSAHQMPEAMRTTMARKKPKR